MYPLFRSLGFGYCFQQVGNLFSKQGKMLWTELLWKRNFPKWPNQVPSPNETHLYLATNLMSDWGLWWWNLSELCGKTSLFCLQPTIHHQLQYLKESKLVPYEWNLKFCKLWLLGERVWPGFFKVDKKQNDPGFLFSLVTMFHQLHLQTYNCKLVVDGPRGVLPEKFGRSVRPASQSPYPVYDQNLWFFLPHLWP